MASPRWAIRSISSSVGMIIQSADDIRAKYQPRSLGRFVRKAFIHGQYFGTPVGVLFHVFDNFLAAKHLLERVAFENHIFPILAESRVFADLQQRLLDDTADRLWSPRRERHGGAEPVCGVDLVNDVS